MDKETKKAFRNHKPGIKYKEVPLTDEEYDEALCNKAQCESMIESLELNLKHLNIDEENKYTERMSVANARKRLKDIRDKLNDDIKMNKDNLKVYSRQIETKKREEPIMNEEAIEDIVPKEE